MKNLTNRLKTALYIVLVLMMMVSFNACGGGDTGDAGEGTGQEIEETEGGAVDEEGVGEGEGD